MSEVILKKENHIALMTLNRPSSLNALCVDFMEEIDRCLDMVSADSDIYVLIITGTGRSFIAGADIGEMYPKDSEAIFKWSGLGSQLNLKLEKMRIPVIAAINGYALGGGLELAMACDIRLAADSARLGLTETSLGVICAAGGTQRLPRIVGRSRASEMIFSARIIDAEEALAISLVDYVYPADELIDKATALACSICKNGQLAVKAAKKALAHSEISGIEDGCLYEREIFSSLFETEDQKIGMGGFLKKEKEIHFKNK